MLRPLRDADRHGHASGGLELDVPEALGHARRQAQRVACIARRHDHAELLTADATDDVGVAHRLSRQARELDQQLIAGSVTVDVVDPLEVVEVEHQDGDRVVRARRPRQFGAEPVMEEAMVVEPGQRVGLREMLEARADLRVVDRKRRSVAEPLRELELVRGETGLLTDAVDVERTFERAAGDQRHADQRLGLDRRSRNGDHARVEVRLVRPDRTPVLDRPAGDAFPEAGTTAHDLALVGLGTGQHRDQFSPVLVDLVDVQRLVGHEVGERPGDALEERVDTLLRQDQVEDLGQAPIRLDQVLRPAAPVLARARSGLECRSRLRDHSRDHRRPQRLP